MCRFAQIWLSTSPSASTHTAEIRKCKTIPMPDSQNPLACRACYVHRGMTLSLTAVAVSGAAGAGQLKKAHLSDLVHAQKIDTCCCAACCQCPTAPGRAVTNHIAKRNLQNDNTAKGTGVAGSGQPTNGHTTLLSLIYMLPTLA